MCEEYNDKGNEEKSGPWSAPIGEENGATCPVPWEMVLKITSIRLMKDFKFLVTLMRAYFVAA